MHVASDLSMTCMLTACLDNLATQLQTLRHCCMDYA